MSRGWRISVTGAAVVALVAAVSVAAWLLAGQQSGNDAFLERVSTEIKAVRSFHTTFTGTTVMTDGTVIHSAGEGDSSFSDSGRGWANRFRITYEECAFPISSYGSLCSTESVFVDGIFYVKETTDSGPGEWEIQELSPPISASESPPSPFDTIDGLIELGEESIDWVVYRRFRGTVHPEERMIERLEAGEWEPPVKIPREETIASLRKAAEETIRTVEVWVGKDDYLVWRIIIEAERTAQQGRSGIVRESNITEYSRYNEPVLIEPPR